MPVLVHVQGYFQSGLLPTIFCMSGHIYLHTLDKILFKIMTLVRFAQFCFHLNIIITISNNFYSTRHGVGSLSSRPLQKPIGMEH